MILTCPACSTKFNVDAALFREEAVEVRCGSCKHVWVQGPIEDEALFEEKPSVPEENTAEPDKKATEEDAVEPTEEPAPIEEPTEKSPEELPAEENNNTDPDTEVQPPAEEAAPTEEKEKEASDTEEKPETKEEAGEKAEENTETPTEEGDNTDPDTEAQPLAEETEIPAAEKPDTADSEKIPEESPLAEAPKEIDEFAEEQTPVGNLSKEEIAAQRQQARKLEEATARKKSKGVLKLLFFFILFCALSLVLLRQVLVDYVTPQAPLISKNFLSIGLPTYLKKHHLIFSKPKTTSQKMSGEHVLVVSGSVGNVSDLSGKVPPLYISAIGQDGTTLAKWGVTIEKDLLPRKKTDFSLIIDDLPDGTKKMSLMLQEANKTKDLLKVIEDLLPQDYQKSLEEKTNSGGSAILGLAEEAVKTIDKIKDKDEDKKMKKKKPSKKTKKDHSESH